MAQFVSNRFDLDWDDESVLEMARAGIDDEREFNRRAGFDRDDDRLPRWMYDEPLPLPDGPMAFDITPADIDRVWGER
jgi:aldehyde:ferredoxin oxidoreductase